MKKKHRKTRGGRKPRVSPIVMARDFLGMAIEEIRVARTEESIGTQDGNVYARNKALQSAGMLLALAVLGDERAVRATYVAGRQAWGACPGPRISPVDGCGRRLRGVCVASVRRRSSSPGRP